MTLTTDELKKLLAYKDPDELLDLLQLDSATLVELASDIIGERYDELLKEVEDIDEFAPEEFRQ
jgi:hypothetical protein